MRKYTPAEAMALLSSPEAIEYACDVVRNPAFSKADARTKDAHGKRIADYVQTRRDRASWAAELRALVELPPERLSGRLAREAVRLSAIPRPNKSDRVIAVPTFLRRCISNLVKEVLVATSDHMLLPCVHAYRPDREDVVREAILDMAEAVRGGRLRYWFRLDWQSYFNAIRPEHVRSALERLGYPEAFIQRVLVITACPLVKHRHGRMVPVLSDGGLQMGLGESSVLANLVPMTLDLDLGQRKHLVYARYSDDTVGGSPRRDETIAAVRAVQRWSDQHGIALKGVSANTRTSTLVHDVRREKISYLGVEIDQHGSVHLPAQKLREKIAQLDEMYAQLSSDELCCGTSRYGNGGGVHAVDEEDLRKSMAAFIDYWEPLDPRGAERASQIFKRRFPVTPGASATGLGAVWCAQLCGHQTDRESGTTLAIFDPMNTASEQERPPTPTRKSCAPSGPTTGGEALGELSSRDLSSHERSRHSDAESPEPEPVSEAPWVATATMSTEGAAHLGDSSGWTDERHSQESRESGEEVGEAYPLSADGRKTDRFVTRSFVDEVFENLFDDRGGSEDQYTQTLDLEGALSDPGGGASPPLPVFENAQRIFIHAQSVTLGGSRRNRVVLVGTARITEDQMARRATVRVVRDCRPEAALVYAMINMIEGSSGPLVIQMRETWLPKGLLQAHRRFRAPLLFSGVLELHEVARGRDVRVVGSVAVPDGLLREMARAFDRLVRTAA